MQNLQNLLEQLSLKTQNKKKKNRIVITPENIFRSKYIYKMEIVPDTKAENLFLSNNNKRRRRVAKIEEKYNKKMEA